MPNSARARRTHPPCISLPAPDPAAVAAASPALSVALATAAPAFEVAEAAAPLIPELLAPEGSAEEPEGDDESEEAPEPVFWAQSSSTPLATMRAPE